MVAAALMGIGSAAWAATTNASYTISGKGAICGVVGCPDVESRPCADVGGSVGIPGIGEVEVTWHCYEAVKPM